MRRRWCIVGEFFEPGTMLELTTKRFTLKGADYVNVPTYESSHITIQEGEMILEIQGLTQKQIQAAILSYVRGQGYSSSCAAEQSGFLSDLADSLPDATKRVARELESQQA